ncbi:MAG: GNAT family N-acetyltransferase [Patescibacteria group bacterium]|nr:GNAT family N-acetyltransferase [Patescibacteria group bacterium]
MYNLVVVDNTNKEQYRMGFVKTYQTVFAGEPYNEDWKENEVNIIFDDLTKDGSICVVALCNEDIVGFSGSLPLSECDQDVKNLISPVLGMSVFYNAELGVLPEHRGHGLAKQMVDQRVSIARNNGFHYSIMRTTTNGSMSQSIYEKVGFEILTGVEQIVSHERVGETNDSDKRIFLYKELK